MRKVISLLSLFIVILSSSIVAQTLEVEWGAEFDLDRDYRYHKIVGQDVEKFYVIRKEKEKDVTRSTIWLESVSKTSMGIESSYQVTLPEINGKSSNFEGLFYIDSKLILFASVHDQLKQLSNLYVMHIDEDGLSKGSPQLVGFMSLILDPDEGFKFSVTPDNKHILLHYHIPFSTYTGEPLYFKLISSDLEVVENKRFELPYLQSKVQIVNYERGESGNYYFAIQAEPAKKGRTSRAAAGRVVKIQYNYSVLVYNAKKDTLQDYLIKVDKFTPDGIMMTLNEDEDVMVFGFATKRSSAAYSGVYYQRIDPRIEKVTAQNFLDFSKDRAFLAEFKQERNGTNETEWYSYSPGQIVPLDNGGFIYLSEQTYSEKKIISDPKSKKETSVYYYHHNDILAISVDDENKMEWVRRIPKNQFSTNDKGYYSGFTAVAVGSKVKIMFNDHSKNLKNRKPEETKELKNNIMMNPSGDAIVATLYSDGNVDKAEMFPGSDSKFSICPKLFLESRSQNFIYAQKGSSYKWGNFFFE
ncbi:MAG: hypothetical protein K9H64_16850 [Bacteroidales bacterium]|nr:hypothetical protein [Bacteroidales bacterium]MCF8457645.1 hypothetical protein [Bacteroidales bacterium]